MRKKVAKGCRDLPRPRGGRPVGVRSGSAPSHLLRKLTTSERLTHLLKEAFERLIHNTTSRAALGAADLERAAREDRRPHQASVGLVVDDVYWMAQGHVHGGWARTPF